ncbi:hypothetical protein BGY98DRAFT_374534 [Russula aff. rugulosa BPL654]|nr:hypothetical protein BGY98DRAFT_374534 [Russula aff. rugulosa BPL654]
MPLSSRKKLPFNPSAANGPASQSSQGPRPVCTWSAHAPQSGPSPLPFPRFSHTLTGTPTPTPLGELFLFGGYVRGHASSDMYVCSTGDFSTKILQTSGEVPTPRAAHGAALIGTNLLICGGTMNFGERHALNHGSLYLLNLVSREWTRVVVNGPEPGGRYYHTTTVAGSKLFVFGGRIGGKTNNDMWALDLNCRTFAIASELY